MTEEEWWGSTYPPEMLKFLDFNISFRKQVLFNLACCRRIEDRLPNELCHRVLRVGEQFAEGEATEEELEQACDQAFDSSDEDDIAMWASEAVGSLNDWGWPSDACCNSATQVIGLIEDGPDVHLREAMYQATLLRDIVGNPFQPVKIDPAWIAWNAGAVKRIAERIYRDQQFGDMPVLADALEEAGCNVAAILEHSRGPGPHVRGCWVLDLILGRE